MESTAKKTLNRVKDGVKQRRESPASADQSTVPITDAIRAYWERDLLTFSIPAHSGGRGPAPEFTKWAGPQLARVDLPATHGIDTRNQAYNVQATAEARPAAGHRRRLGDGLCLRRARGPAPAGAGARSISGNRVRPQDAHRPVSDLGAVGRLKPDRYRAAVAVLRARGGHQQLGTVALEHPRRAPGSSWKRCCAMAALSGARSGSFSRADEGSGVLIAVMICGSSISLGTSRARLGRTCKVAPPRPRPSSLPGTVSTSMPAAVRRPSSRYFARNPRPRRERSRARCYRHPTVPAQPPVRRHRSRQRVRVVPRAPQRVR